VSKSEHAHWQKAAASEGERYGVDPEYTRSRIAGESASIVRRRTWVDWLVVSVATATIVGFALIARAPQIAVGWGWAAALVIVTLGMLALAGARLWRATRFN
jgi:hypothetical protein